MARSRRHCLTGGVDDSDLAPKESWRKCEEKWVVVVLTITEFNKFANNKLSQIGRNLQRIEL
jgi:hypothetical protein